MSSIDRYLVPSADYVGSLDRSILGSFAVDRDALQGEDSRVRLLMEQPRNWAFIETIYGLDVHAELMWWWRKRTDLSENGKAMLAIYMTEIVDGDVEVRMAQLDLVSSHPELHGYFAADVWDVAFAGKCLSDDIDPEMAGKL